MQWYTSRFRSRSARACLVASARALSVACCATGRTLSAAGAAPTTVGPAAVATTARRPRATSAAPARGLSLKNLFLAHRDGLAPPAFRTGRVDVGARDPGVLALAVAHREPHVTSGREVRGVLLPGLPLFRGGAARRRQHQAEDQRKPQSIDAHGEVLRE